MVLVHYLGMQNPIPSWSIKFVIHSSLSGYPSILSTSYLLHAAGLSLVTYV